MPETGQDREAALNTLWRLGREAALVLRMVQMTAALERSQVEVSELLRLEEDVSEDFQRDFSPSGSLSPSKREV